MSENAGKQADFIDIIASHLLNELHETTVRNPAEAQEHAFKIRDALTAKRWLLINVDDYVRRIAELLENNTALLARIIDGDAVTAQLEEALLAGVRVTGGMALMIARLRGDYKEPGNAP